MKSGGIRLQYSVYEFNNTSRLINNIKETINSKFSKLFTPDDSVLIFEVKNDKIEKYGNAIHRDRDILFL
jgi:CRISPR-associated protein Cas2